MKKTILTILSVIIFSTGYSQLNQLNDTEFLDGIKFNDVSIVSIMKSQGNLQILKKLVGNDLQDEMNYTGFYPIKYIYNENITFGFEDESQTGNDYYLTSLKVKNKTMNVKIKNIDINLGDSKSKLSNFLFNSTYGGYVFTDEDTGSISFAIKIDKESNTISEITYTNF